MRNVNRQFSGKRAVTQQNLYQVCALLPPAGDITKISNCFDIQIIDLYVQINNNNHYFNILQLPVYILAIEECFLYASEHSSCKLFIHFFF